MAGWSILKDGYQLNCTENRESDEFNNGCSSDSDNDVKWEDCDGKFRCLFDQVLMVLLRGVYAKNGIRPIPALLGSGESVDLFKLFCLVRDRGGFSSVSREKLWGLVAEKFGFDYRISASLKLIYFKYLDELDRWLNRITRDRILANGSYDCGGNLGLLSLELEKRFRDFSTHGKERVNRNENIGYDELCEHIDVALKQTLHPPNGENGGTLHYSVVDDDDKLCDNEEFYSKANQRAVNKDNTSRKRKRDDFAGMLRWMIKAAKNPCHPSIGMIPGCSKWKEKEGKDFWSVSLMVRETRLRRRCVDSNDEQSPAHQKKQKMHPSLYEDDTVPSHRSAGGLRSSERLLSVVKASCPCCKPPSDHRNKVVSPCRPPPENCLKEQEHEKLDSLGTERTVGQSNDDLPIQKQVLVGLQFQAEVPVWTGFVSRSDPKWLGTQIWSPENSCSEMEFVGQGRSDSCSCRFPGSVECYRFHIAEQRMKLRQELGLVFYHWKFDRMGEEVSLSWSVEEEKRFKQVVRLNKPLLGKSFFSRKTWTDLVSYYYNVFLINRRSYQNRVTPKEIDSDDDEAEFGSVSEAFGYNAVKVPGSEPLTCCENKQVIDFH